MTHQPNSILPSDPRGSILESLLQGVSGGIASFNDARASQGADLSFLNDVPEGAVRGDLTGPQITAIANQFDPAVANQIMKGWRTQQLQEMATHKENASYGKVLADNNAKAMRLRKDLSKMVDLLDKGELSGKGWWLALGSGLSDKTTTEARLRSFIHDALTLSGQSASEAEVKAAEKAFIDSGAEGKRALLMGWAKRAHEAAQKYSDYSQIYSAFPALPDLEGHLERLRNARSARSEEEARAEAEEAEAEEADGVPSEDNITYQTQPGT